MEVSSLRYPVAYWNGRPPQHHCTTITIHTFNQNESNPQSNTKQKPDANQPNQQHPAAAAAETSSSLPSPGTASSGHGTTHGIGSSNSPPPPSSSSSSPSSSFLSSPLLGYCLTGSITGELIHWEIRANTHSSSSTSSSSSSHPSPHVCVPRALLLRTGSSCITASCTALIDDSPVFITSSNEGFLSLWSITGGRCIRSALCLPFSANRLIPIQMDQEVGNRYYKRTILFACAGTNAITAGGGGGGGSGGGRTHHFDPSSSSSSSSSPIFDSQSISSSDESLFIYVLLLPELRVFRMLRHPHLISDMQLTPLTYSRQRYLMVMTQESEAVLWDLEGIVDEEKGKIGGAEEKDGGGGLGGVEPKHKRKLSGSQHLHHQQQQQQQQSPISSNAFLVLDDPAFITHVAPTVAAFLPPPPTIPTTTTTTYSSPSLAPFIYHSTTSIPHLPPPPSLLISSPPSSSSSSSSSPLFFDSHIDVLRPFSFSISNTGEWCLLMSSHHLWIASMITFELESEVVSLNQFVPSHHSFHRPHSSPTCSPRSNFHLSSSNHPPTETVANKLTHFMGCSFLHSSSSSSSSSVTVQESVWFVPDHRFIVWTNAGDVLLMGVINKGELEKEKKKEELVEPDLSPFSIDPHSPHFHHDQSPSLPSSQQLQLPPLSRPSSSTTRIGSRLQIQLIAKLRCGRDDIQTQNYRSSSTNMTNNMTHSTMRTNTNGAVATSPVPSTASSSGLAIPSAPLPVRSISEDVVSSSSSSPPPPSSNLRSLSDAGISFSSSSSSSSSSSPSSSSFSTSSLSTPSFSPFYKPKLRVAVEEEEKEIEGEGSQVQNPPDSLLLLTNPTSTSSSSSSSNPTTTATISVGLTTNNSNSSSSSINNSSSGLVSSIHPHPTAAPSSSSPSSSSSSELPASLPISPLDESFLFPSCVLVDGSRILAANFRAEIHEWILPTDPSMGAGVIGEGSGGGKENDLLLSPKQMSTPSKRKKLPIAGSTMGVARGSGNGIGAMPLASPSRARAMAMTPNSFPIRTSVNNEGTENTTSPKFSSSSSFSTSSSSSSSFTFLPSVPLFSSSISRLSSAFPPRPLLPSDDCTASCILSEPVPPGLRLVRGYASGLIRVFHMRSGGKKMMKGGKGMSGKAGSGTHTPDPNPNPSHHSHSHHHTESESSSSSFVPGIAKSISNHLHQFSNHFSALHFHPLHSHAPIPVHQLPSPPSPTTTSISPIGTSTIHPSSHHHHSHSHHSHSHHHLDSPSSSIPPSPTSSSFPTTSTTSCTVTPTSLELHGHHCRITSLLSIGGREYHCDVALLASADIQHCVRIWRFDELSDNVECLHLIQCHQPIISLHKPMISVSEKYGFHSSLNGNTSVSSGVNNSRSHPTNPSNPIIGGGSTNESQKKKNGKNGETRFVFVGC